MIKLKSVILIDNNEIDNFINRKILEHYGITNIISFKNPSEALSFLKTTVEKYQLILVDVYLPMIDGFEFIDKFNELGLNKTQGEIVILSTSMNPVHLNKAKEMNIAFIDKPLTIEKLLKNI